SLACGTPVVAFPEGAAPEIVDHRRTGFLCGNEDAMAAAVHRVGELSRPACRAAVEARFSAAAMVDAHLALYRRVLNGEILTAPSKPAAPLDQPALAPNGQATRARPLAITAVPSGSCDEGYLAP